MTYSLGFSNTVTMELCSTCPIKTTNGVKMSGFLSALVMIRNPVAHSTLIAVVWSQCCRILLYFLNKRLWLCVLAERIKTGSIFMRRHSFYLGVKGLKDIPALKLLQNCAVGRDSGNHLPH